MAQTGASYVEKTTTKQTNEIPLCFVFSSFLYLESCKFGFSFMFHEQITSSTLHGASEHGLICQRQTLSLLAAVKFCVVKCWLVT